MNSSNKADHAPVTKARFYAIMVVLMLTEILGSLGHTMVITALGTVAKDVGGITNATWLITAFALSGAATAAIGGRLGDMFGRRLVLTVIIGLMGIGSLISVLSHDLMWIIVGRVFQGVAGAVLPLCYGITREVAAPGKAPVWIGLLTGAYSFSSAIGYILGGHYADIGEWRGIFWLTTIAAALLVAPIYLIVPAPKVSRPGRFDFIGAILFAPAVAAILYGITASKERGWHDSLVLGCVGMGVLMLVVWWFHELRDSDPLIDVRLLRRRQIWVGNVCGALSSIGMMQLPVVALLLLQQPRMAGIGLAVTGYMAGILKLPSNVASLFAAPVSGWISQQNRGREAMIWGALVGVAGWGWLYFLHDTVMEVVIGTCICAFGSSMLLASIPNLVLEGTPPDRSSEVTGLTGVVRSMFSGIGAQTMALLLATSQMIQPGTGRKLPSEAAYKTTFLFIVIVSAAIAILCILVKPRRAQDADIASKQVQPVAGE